jgi:hypothetical protein
VREQACIWAANNNRPWCGAWLSASLHSTPFAADHLLENALWTNNGTRPFGGYSRGHRGILAVCSHPSVPPLENRLCSECRRFAFPKACISICDCDGAGY